MPVMSRKRIVVTGMSGLIGGIMRRELESDYELVAVNRREVAGVECHQADVANFEAIRAAFDGADCVLHLAALAEMDAGIDAIVSNNIVGTYNVFEAACEAGVSRIVFASSGAAIGNYELDAPYSQLQTIG